MFLGQGEQNEISTAVRIQTRKQRQQQLRSMRSGVCVCVRVCDFCVFAVRPFATIISALDINTWKGTAFA